MIYFFSPTTHPKEAGKHCLEIKCVLNEMHYLPYIFWWGWSAWFLQIFGACVPSVHQPLLMWVWLQYHVCFSVILHGSQAPACINLPVSCGQVLISLVQSLFILLSRSLRALSHFNAPSPLLCLSQQRICDCWALTSITVG